MPRRVEIEVEMLEAKKQRKRSSRRKKPRKSNANDGSDRPTRTRRARKPKTTLEGRRHWVRKLDICGQRYDVRVDTSFHNAKWEGSCTWSANLIEILEQAEDRMHDALLHEIIHAMNDASGLKWEIANRFKKKLTVEDRRDLDELLCRHLAPAILQTFRNAGWLRLPRWP